MRTLVFSFLNRLAILVLDLARFLFEAGEHAVIVGAICRSNTYKKEIRLKKQRICTEGRRGASFMTQSHFPSYFCTFFQCMSLRDAII